MASFFFRKQKSEVVKPASDLLQKLWQSPTPSKVGNSNPDRVYELLTSVQQVEDELARYLSQMKMMLQGTQGNFADQGILR